MERVMERKTATGGQLAPRIISIPNQWIVDVPTVVVGIATVWDQTPSINVELNNRFLIKDVKTQLFTPIQNGLGYLAVPPFSLKPGDVITHTATTLVLYGYHTEQEDRRVGLYVHGFSFNEAGITFGVPRGYRYTLHDVRLLKDGSGMVPNFILKADSKTIATAPLEAFAPAWRSNLPGPADVHEAVILTPGGKLTATVRGIFVMTYETTH